MGLRGRDSVQTALSLQTPSREDSGGGNRKAVDAVAAVVLVFVYGTLTDRERVEAILGENRPGEGKASASGSTASESIGYEFQGPATLEGCHRVDGRYPTLAPGGSVEGRLLSLGTGGLEALDRYEGVGRGLYVRVEVPLRGDDRSAWTYVGDPERLGVGDAATWSESCSSAEAGFEERVRSYVEERCVVRKADDS